jgi:hypothetical protein
LANLIKTIAVLFIFASGAWVYWDATAKKIGRIPGRKGYANYPAGFWAFLTCWIWLLGFTVYMSNRRSLIELAKTNPIEVKRRGFKLSVFVFFGLLCALAQYFDTDEEKRANAKRQARPDSAAPTTPTPPPSLQSEVPARKPDPGQRATDNAVAAASPVAVEVKVPPLQKSAQPDPPAVTARTQSAHARSKSPREPIAAIAEETGRSAADMAENARALAWQEKERIFIESLNVARTACGGRAPWAMSDMARWSACMARYGH